MNNPNKKESNLLKGAMRRIFSRSELRLKVINRHNLDFKDPNRPRVTKWSFCDNCGCIEPKYLLEVDHILPVIPLDKTLEDLTWDQLVDRLWCDESNLQICCESCHREKSKLENQERRANRNGKK